MDADVVVLNKLKGRIMEKKNKEQKREEQFIEPKVLASYNEKDLDEIIKPHGTPNQPGGGGCGGSGIIIPS